MKLGPQNPIERGDHHLDADEKLNAEGWADGLHVWTEVADIYAGAIRSGAVANAQLWSLREAVRAEAFAEVRTRIETLLDEVGPDGEREDGWSGHAVDRVRELLEGL